jgi:putative two-component system response regulator
METINVLAVDDEAFNLDLIEFAFSDHSEITLFKAENGQEAVNLLKSTPGIDVILLDLAMPIMSGFDVLDTIAEDEALKTIPVIVVTANAEEKHRALSQGATDFLSKPFDVDELKIRTFNYARISNYQKQIRNQNEQLEQRVAERTEELRKALKLATETEYEISSRLGKASEYRDLETGMHIKRMSHYSAKLAELAGLDAGECELVLYASPLHDIGKVGIPDNILLKPGRFTAEEFDIMKLHAEIGAKMLEGGDQYPVIEAGRIIALQHHEKYDGTGYPNGTAGKEIHIFGRIVAIADVFDALSSKRVYKEAMPLDKTLAIMTEERGKHFDPELLDLFVNNLDAFLEIRDRFPEEEAIPSIMQLLNRHGTQA